MTPMMEQYWEIKKQYMDYIVFYRLGDFYEMFFDGGTRPHVRRSVSFL